MSNSTNIIKFRISQNLVEYSSKTRSVYKSSLVLNFGNWNLSKKDVVKDRGFQLDITKKFYLNGRTSDIPLENFIRRCENVGVEFSRLNIETQQLVRESRADKLLNAERITFDEFRFLIRRRNPFVVNFDRAHKRNQ